MSFFASDDYDRIFQEIFINDLEARVKGLEDQSHVVKALHARVTLLSAEFERLTNREGTVKGQVEDRQERVRDLEDGKEAKPIPARFERPCFSADGVAFRECNRCAYANDPKIRWDNCQSGAKSPHLAAYRGETKATNTIRICPKVGMPRCVGCYHAKPHSHHEGCSPGGDICPACVESPPPPAPKLEDEPDALPAAQFKGNSVEYWWAKATAYKGIVFGVCEAFRSLGYESEFGSTDTLPARLKEYADIINVRLRVAEVPPATLYRCTHAEQCGDKECPHAQAHEHDEELCGVRCAQAPAQNCRPMAEAAPKPAHTCGECPDFKTCGASLHQGQEAHPECRPNARWREAEARAERAEEMYLALKDDSEKLIGDYRAERDAAREEIKTARREERERIAKHFDDLYTGPSGDDYPAPAVAKLIRAMPD